MKERIAPLRRYRWSSYRAYVELGKRPEWLERERVWELGGGKQEQRVRNDREYVESAVREGLETSPWGELQDQVVLGGETFLQELRAHVTGSPREQRGVKRLARSRPKLEEVIASVEKVKGRTWGETRDRYGDDGRDLVLPIGRRACGLKLGELAAAAGMSDDKAVWAALRRYERRLERSPSGRELLKQVCQMSKVEM